MLQLCDTLISITWVDHQGNIRNSKRDSQEARIFCGGMGLIGLITELELQLTAPTHTKLITRYLSPDTNLVADIEKMLKVSAAVVLWFVLLVFVAPFATALSHSCCMMHLPTTDSRQPTQASEIGLHAAEP